MKYRRMVPRIVYRAHDVELPDAVDPMNYQLAPGERLVDESGLVLKEGPSLDALLSTVQDVLSDAQDMLQDARDSYDGT